MYQLSTVETAELKAHVERANKARREGVKLLRDRISGQHWATSASRPFVKYYVTLFSCTCPGFITHGHCKHNSALIVAHLLQEGHTGEPDTCPVAMDCTGCEGRGYWIKARQIGRGEFVRDDVPCPQCQGSGKREPIAA